MPFQSWNLYCYLYYKPPYLPQEKHQINMDDDIKFPTVKQKWKAYVEMLAKEGKQQQFRIIFWNKHSYNKKIDKSACYIAIIIVF